jgi:hypothetical protein
VTEYASNIASTKPWILSSIIQKIIWNTK